jgi:hypothetical protein
MKTCMFMAVWGCLFLMAGCVYAQPDRGGDRYPQKGEARIRPGDMRVLQLEISPDPVREGQRISFRVIIGNTSGHSGRISFILKDRDDIISEARDVPIYPGESRVDFPQSNYRFSRSDHCFTVEADIERSRQQIDLAREFCAQRTSKGWTITDKGMGYLVVEDLDMVPDPAIPGQAVRFRVRLRNDGKAIRGTIRIQDKDQAVVQVENLTIPRGVSDVQFPYTKYSFQQFDHCFTVVVDFEKTPYPVDAAREFCAKPTGWTLKP